jgi:FkbM family methyltransferase
MQSCCNQLFTLKKYSGLSMKNAAPRCGSSDRRNVEYDEAFSPLKFFQSLLPTVAPIILDVGGHRGESVCFFREIFPECKIYSFEPDPDNFEELEKCCVNLNNFSWGTGGAFAINQAVSDKSGVASFFKQDISHLGGLLPINKGSVDSLGYAENALNQQIFVQVVTLDEFIVEKDLQRIDLLKIDAQGSEVAVLKGAKKLLKKIYCCTVEVSFYDFYENSSTLLLVEQAMQDAGLVLWDISKLSKNPKNFRTDWAELVYVRRRQT